MSPVCVSQGGTLSPSTGASVFSSSCGDLLTTNLRNNNLLHQRPLNVAAPCSCQMALLCLLYCLHICKHQYNQIERLKNVFLLLMVAPFLALLLSHLISPCSNFKSCNSSSIYLHLNHFPFDCWCFSYCIWTLEGPPGMLPRGNCQNRFPCGFPRLFFCYCEENDLSCAPSGKTRA